MYIQCLVFMRYMKSLRVKMCLLCSDKIRSLNTEEMSLLIPTKKDIRCFWGHLIYLILAQVEFIVLAWRR